MFKKSLLAAIVLVMIAVTHAHADTRIWVAAGSPSEFNSFQSAMEKQGWTRGVHFLSGGLAAAACGHAEQKGINKSADCPQQFLQRNGITSELVSTSEFFARNRGEGWWIPHDPKVVSSTQAVVQPTREAAPVAIQPGADVVALKAQLQRLQGAVGQMSRGNQQVAELQRAIDGLAAKLATAEKTLGSVPGMQEVQRGLAIGLANLEEGKLTDAMIGSIGQQVEAAQTRLTEELQAALQTALETEIKTLKTDGALGHGLVAKVSPEAASGYAEHSTAIYASLIALAFGLGLILFAVLNSRQKKVAVAVREHNQILHDEGGVLDRLSEVEGGLQEELMKTHALQKAVVDLVGQVDETHEMVTVTQKDIVRFDDDNPGLDVLLHSLALGQENGVEWTGSYCGKRFSVKIWRDVATPMGQVQTNVVRNVESGQLAEPMALKRLKQRIEAAVISGRVPLMEAVKKVA